MEVALLDPHTLHAKAGFFLPGSLLLSDLRAVGQLWTPKQFSSPAAFISLLAPLNMHGLDAYTPGAAIVFASTSGMPSSLPRAICRCCSPGCPTLCVHFTWRSGFRV